MKLLGLATVASAQWATGNWWDTSATGGYGGGWYPTSYPSPCPGSPGYYYPNCPSSNSFGNTLGTAVLANSFGGGVGGALIASGLTGQPNNNNLATTLIASQALGGSGLGGIGGNDFLTAAALTGGLGGGSNNIGNAFLTASVGSSLGGGIGGFVAADALLNRPTGPSYGGYGGRGGYGGSDNLVTTVALSSALSGSGGSGLSSALPLLAVAQPGGFQSPIGTALVANQFGGGVQGALVADAITRPSYGYGGSSNNLATTLALSGALGGSGLGGSGSIDTTTALVLSGALGGNNNDPCRGYNPPSYCYGRGGYGGIRG